MLALCYYRRSPAYARRQERRRAAREAAAEQVPASDIPAAEAKMDEDEESTEEVESPPPPQIVSECEAEAPEWFREHLKPDIKLYGNTRLVVSNQLFGILRPGLEVFSLADCEEFVELLSTRGGYSPGCDFFSTDENLKKIFRSERVDFSAMKMKKRFQHHVYHGGKNICSGYDIGRWHCRHFYITFDNLL